jgi:protein TonB
MDSDPASDTEEEGAMLSFASVAFSLVIGAAWPGGWQQAPPRDLRTVVQPQGDTAGTEAALQKTIAESPSEVAAYLALARMQEQRAAYADAEATLVRAREIAPAKKEVHLALARLFNRRGDFEHTIASLDTAAQLTPSDPAGHQLVATYYWEKASKDKQLTPAERWTYIFEGINATDRALAVNPDYVEALTYKNILLRMRAPLESDPAQQKASLAEADALRNRAMALNKARTGVTAETNLISASGMPVAVPASSRSGQAPVRVGGNIKPPTKIRHVPPVYPPEAQTARIEGVVIIEATIGVDGRVSDARILRSIQLLDQAAVDAVRQWEFTPTVLEGVGPVPVIMTVTVNFTLQ